jgi:flavin reductase (DIM6/NTAB) family NADH-FMN oxidoreductase RutF
MPADGDRAVNPVGSQVGSRRALRDVLGRYGTGVAVVTTVLDGRAAGLTVNSFTSVSLDPPLVLWCLSAASRSTAAFTGAEHFAVNILTALQHAVAENFTLPQDRFAGLAYRAGPYGLPVLDRTAGTLICRRDRLVPAGDHLVVFGEVVQCHAGPGSPLLFVDGSYHAGPCTDRAR